jgi:transglutaminase-like putative cysteine protease
VQYRVTHRTAYEYSGSVSVSHHLARLAPRHTERQRAVEHQLNVDPPPDLMSSHSDYFGNETAFFIVQSSHRRLEVSASSMVDVSAAGALDRSKTPPWEQVAEASKLPVEAIEQAIDQSSIRLSAELAAYVRPQFPPGRPLLEAVEGLTARIHADFVYDPAATTIATPLATVFERRRGVCQDFARFEIACLRTLGVPARYVSGYLETVPPPGVARLVGADASHAWLSVYCPGEGWVDVDPTNNLFPSDTHITLGWGRDFNDVSPIRGVILGGGDHSLTVSVDVVRQQQA